MTNKNNPKITFVFSPGRLEKLNNENFADEFFYAYPLFEKHFKNVNLIELKNSNKTHLIFIDKFLRKITKLPFYLDIAHNKKNFSYLKESDYIIFGNDRLALSSLLMIKRLNRIKKINSTFFVMGLLPNNKEKFFIKKLQFSLINKLCKEFDNLIFLSNSEFIKTTELFPKFNYKFKFIPFSIDTKFWSEDLSKIKIKKNKIIFIGNDGRRDYQKVVQIAKKLPDYQFIFITSQLTDKDLGGSNIELIKGHWNSTVLTDKEIKKYYLQSKLTILPLIDSYQPSGQSVTLQSMAAGTPVMISKTKGFWNLTDFRHYKEIIFVDNNSVDNWVKKIKKVYNNEEMLETISKKGQKLILNKYNLEIFYDSLKKQLNIN